LIRYNERVLALPTDSDAALADAARERVALAEGWHGWGLLCVRSAGFAAAGVEGLAAPRSAAAADAVLTLEARLERTIEAARDAVGDAIRAGAGDAGQLRKLLRSLRKDGPRRSEPVPPSLSPYLERLQSEQRELETARAGLEASLLEEGEQISLLIRKHAADPRFREALLWQNRQVVHRGLDVLLRQPAGARDSQTRKKELMIASYLQRYCVKNDTIGFFGPIGWLRYDRCSPPLLVRPGAALLKNRDVSLEHWAVSAIADRLAEDRELRLQLAPRRQPTIFVEGKTLHHPIDRRSPLPEEFAQALASCDGTRSAAAIIAALAAEGIEDGEALLEELSERKLIFWTLEIPSTVTHPERILRAKIERLSPSPARDRALSVVGEMAETHGALARAGGSPTAVDAAAEGLGSWFERVAGRAAVRRDGQAYAARTLFYEDCRRDLDGTIGPAVIRELAPPLTLLMQSARWYTHAVAERYEKLFQSAYRELREAHGPVLDYLRFWERIAPEFPSSPQNRPAIVREVTDQLQTRWKEVLGNLEDRAHLDRSERLAPLVARTFAAPHPGWPTARYHTPDLMLAAHDADAVARGDYLIILGEVHLSLHTYSMEPFPGQHPSGESIIAGREADLPEPCIAPVISRGQAVRGDHSALARHNLDVELGDGLSFRRREQVLAVGELLVEEQDGRLRVRTRDGSRSFPIIQFLEYYLIMETASQFSLLPPAPHTPRITIDRLVLSRERWRFAPTECIFAHRETAQERFLETRRWARQHGLPRQVFLRVPEENKPTYVDFDSPIYVELFTKLVRNASQLSISELLPHLDELWLRDAAGAAYTSEIRMACVDPEPWRER
jgi:hypothetical protein